MVFLGRNTPSIIAGTHSEKAKYLPPLSDSIPGIVIGIITIPVMLDSITGIVISLITVPVMVISVPIALHYRFCN